MVFYERQFESINRPSGGRIRCYVVNPLSSVDLGQVFGGLGYKTKPLKDFGFKNRNVHFAAASRPGAKESISAELQQLFADALPLEPGLFRLCTEPPDDRAYSFRTFDDRWIDVPTSCNATNTSGVIATSEPPLVVPVDKKYTANGPGVVLKRTAEHVGFNGLKFRGKMSFPELDKNSYVSSRDAWPPGLLRVGEAGYESDALRCAPHNWVVKRPVGHHTDDTNVFPARYPPPRWIALRGEACSMRCTAMGPARTESAGVLKKRFSGYQPRRILNHHFRSKNAILRRTDSRTSRLKTQT